MILFLIFVITIFAVLYFFIGALTVDYFYRYDGNGYSAKNDKPIGCVPSQRSAVKKRLT